MLIQAKLKKQYARFNILKAYVDLIEDANQKMNLTGFSKQRLWEEGIYESIAALDSIATGKLLDIGAGAGFPSVPAAIVNPNLNVTIYEPLQKRAQFLAHVIQTLNLPNIKLQTYRAETSPEVEKYDFVTARAVAALAVLVEIAHRPLKLKGQMLFIKGPKLAIELKQAEPLIKKLKLTWKINTKKIFDKEIKIIKLIKHEATPKGYPRSWSQIKKEQKNAELPNAQGSSQ